MHRYSTEPTWSVPHFEKMLYDNAQLLGLYADLYVIARHPLARVMVADIAAVAWLFSCCARDVFNACLPIG